MTDIRDIIRAAIPDADDALCEYIVWARTHYPMAPVAAQMLYKAALQYRRATDKGLQLCEFCDRLAENQTEQCLPTCAHCRTVLQNAKAA